MNRSMPLVGAAMLLALAGCSSTSTSSGSPAAAPAAPAAPASSAAAMPTTQAPPPPPPPPPAPKVIYEKSGTGTFTTPKFDTPAEWQVQWNYDCSGQLNGQGNFAVMPGGGDFSGPTVNELGAKGADTANAHDDAGSHYLQVISECPWTIKVIG